MSELNIGGSNMTVELRDNDTLYAEAQTGNKQWVAVVTDTHPKYNYDRDFVAYQKPKTSNRDSGTATVEEGAVIERVRYTHSGKNRSDSFYQLVDGEAHQIDEADVEAALDGEIVVDVEAETHECEACGDEFDSAHGLAIHEGMVHGADEDDQSDETKAEADPDAATAAVTDGGADYEAPTPEDFPLGEERTLVEHEQDGDAYAGLKYLSADAGFQPGVPHYYVSVRGVATIELNIGIERPDFEDNWSGGSWDEFLSGFIGDGAGMEVGELLVWRRPSDDTDSHVQARYTLDGNRVVETDETVEEMARRLLEELLAESDHHDGDGDETAVADGGDRRPDIPESVRSDEPHQLDGKGLFDIGYDIVEEDDGTIVLTPSSIYDSIDEPEDPAYVEKAMNALGYELVEQTETKAVFEPVEDDDPDTRSDGGLEVREYNEVRHSDDLVRDYRTPPGERLFAYRSEDGDHHVVVSRGNEPADHWERRVPATRMRVVPGQRLWTVPDNWDQRVVSKRDDHAMGIYYVPETDHWVKLSIPTNNWLGDAWFGVRAVGDLDVEPVGTLGSARDVRQLARKYEDEHDHEGAAEDAALFRGLASNWDEVETELEFAAQWVRDEGLDQIQPGDQPIPAGSDWTVEFHQDRIFRAGEAVKRAVDMDAYAMPLSAVLEALREPDLLPSYYSFRVTIDASALGMDHSVRALVEAGCSAAEALDYHMVERAGLTQTAWADERGVGQSTVSGNVSAAKRELQP